MSGENEYTVIFHLIHGEPIKFSATLTDAELMNKADDIEYMLNRYALAMEVDQKLLIVPYSNIKYIEASPSPPQLPLFMIKGAVSVP
jgi:regulatory protein YycH of two-component signal transduction system YycFG